MSERRGPLAGFRVLDCSTSAAGAITTMVLADYGADVVLLEPAGGHPLRGTTELRAWGRGKRSAIVDAPGQPSDDLLRWADVLVEDGVGGRLPTTDRSAHPHLVRCTITPYGPDDWQSDATGDEDLLQARLGLRQGPDGPELLGFPWAAYGASFLAEIGILSALYARGEGSPGQDVTVSLADGVLALATMQGMWAVPEPGHEAPPIAIGVGRRLLVKMFPCAGGEWIALHTGAPGAFTRLMGVLGLADKFSPSPTPNEMGVPLTEEEARVVEEDVPRAIASFRRQDLLEKVWAAEATAVPVLRPGEPFDDPQVVHNRLIVEVDDPDAGRLRQVGPPLQLALTPGSVDGPLPGLGADTDAVLSEAAAAPARPAPTRPHKAHVLEGLKIVDLGQYFAAPYGPRMLSDLGAEVVKVESPTSDPMRPLHPVFEACQRGKRDIALGLKGDRAREVVYRLVADADLVSHNFRPGVAERLGVADADLRAINPNLVYCANHGFGADGPKARLQSFAPMQQGFSGLSYLVNGEGNDPVNISPNEDYFNALLGAVGALMALLHRQRTGEGQFVVSPQINSALFAVTHVMTDANGSMLPLPRLDSARRGYDAFVHLYQAADGWLAVASRTDAERTAFLDAVGLASSDADRDDLTELAAKAIGGATVDQWVGVLKAAGVPCEPAATTSWLDKGLWLDERHQTVGRVTEQDHYVAGRVLEMANMITLSDSPIRPRGPAPTIGQHSREVLAELGYGDAEVEALLASGEVAAADS